MLYEPHAGKNNTLKADFIRKWAAIACLMQYFLK